MSAPSFRLADKLVGFLRGFDMGDDPARLEECEALAEEEEEGLSPWGWCFFGLLLWRAGRFEEAAAAHRKAAALGEAPVTNGLLSALAALRAGASEDALGALEALVRAGERDEDVGPMRLHTALGHALRAAGRPDEAEAAYRAAAAADDTRGEPWAELGRLLHARGEGGATDALARAIQLDPYDHESAYLLAILYAEAGQADAAIEALQAALTEAPSHKAQAHADPRFAPLHGDARFQDLTAPPPPPDLGWLARFPALSALVEAAEALGLRFLSEAEAVKGGEALVEQFTGTYTLGMLWNDALFEACGRAAQGKLRVADTPSVWHRNNYAVAGGLYLDPERPERLFFLPGESVPPVFFHEVDAKPEAVAALLARYYPAAPKPKASLGRHTRLFMGYSEQLQVVHPYSGTLTPIDFHEMDRHLVFSPFLDALLWGSAFEDDPWPDRIPPQPGYAIKLGNKGRELRRQREGGSCRFTRRALFSRAHVGYELHQGNLWVWDLHYDPNPFPELVERLNAVTGLSVPTELPFDVVGAILGFDFMPSSDLEQALEALDDPQMIPAYLRVIAAIRHSDPETPGLLRRYLGHPDPDVRACVANLCLSYNWLGLLEDMAIVEPDPHLAGQLLGALERGIAPPQYTELGEPVGYWDAQDARADEEDGQ